MQEHASVFYLPCVILFLMQTNSFICVYKKNLGDRQKKYFFSFFCDISRFVKEFK